jgi:hypothetical protein
MMTLHIDTLKRTMFDVSHGRPFILCSDTNCKKGYPDRIFLETGVVDQTIRPHTNWTPSPNATYHLKDSLKTEGSPTTRCKPAGVSSDLASGEFFVNIDGIFHHGFDGVGAMVESWINGSLETPCPNETEASDHVALACAITLQK